MRFEKIKSHKEILDPVDCLVVSFEDKDIKEFKEQFEAAQKTGQPIIPIFVNSRGGDVHVLFSYMSLIETANIPVATICTSHAQSAGCYLFSSGTKGFRFASKNASFMIHEVRSALWGKATDMHTDLIEIERIQEQLLAKLAENCGKSVTFIKDKMKENKNSDIHLTAYEALEFGLVDVVFDEMPFFEIETKTSYKFKYKDSLAVSEY